jgi:hypothetical protein
MKYNSWNVSYNILWELHIIIVYDTDKSILYEQFS